MLNEARTELAGCYETNTFISNGSIRKILELRLKMGDFIFQGGEIQDPCNSRELHEYKHFVQGYNNLRKMIDLQEKNK